MNGSWNKLSRLAVSCLGKTKHLPSLIIGLGRRLAPSIWAITRRICLNPRTHYALAWIVAVVTMGLVLLNAWVSFNNTPEHPRNDGNAGHTSIDFGGQWLMGRMLVEGHGRDLYNRKIQREVLLRAYPVEDEEPVGNRAKDFKDDADNLMTWFMGTDGTDDATASVGGPLYPPINALVYYPLALLQPRWGYRVSQLFHLVLALLAGLAVRQLSEGRFWWPVATTLILIYPGFRGSIVLGQNAALTLTILLWGWVLIAKDRPGWGGIIWGLLAFKPVWALAFFLVPLVTGRVAGVASHACHGDCSGGRHAAGRRLALLARLVESRPHGDGALQRQ